MKERLSLLLVEDDETDVMAFTRACKKAGVTWPIAYATDGEEALELIGAEQEGQRIPYVVVLDLNMPNMGGLELIQEVRETPHLADTIFFVYSTSTRDKDISACYAANVAGYFVKSNDGGCESFVSLLKLYCDEVRISLAGKA